MDEKIEVTDEAVEETAAEVTEESQEKKPADKKKVKKLEAECDALAKEKAALEEIGRASCRERVCLSV